MSAQAFLTGQSQQNEIYLHHLQENTYFLVGARVKTKAGKNPCKI